MPISSYPSIFTVGHRQARQLWDDPARLLDVEEKIDGSQFSCHVTAEGELKFRSKGALIDQWAPPAMFAGAVATCVALHERDLLMPGYTYRGEVLQKPKHNTLADPRIPTGHLILFDIMVGEEDYLPRETAADLAQQLGLEYVPLLWRGTAEQLTPQQLRQLLPARSCLGDVEIEGVVVKSTHRNVFGVDKKLIGKLP